RTLRRLFDNRPGYQRVRMAEEEGAVTHDVIDVLIAVDVPFVAPVSMVNEDGERSRVPNVVGYARGKCAQRLRVQALRPRVEPAVVVDDRPRSSHRPEDNRARPRQPANEINGATGG